MGIQVKLPTSSSHIRRRTKKCRWLQAFREGIQRKAARKGKRAVSHEEQTVLAVTALDQEVNNGGYDQFLRNSSRVFAPIVVESLLRVGCKRRARITERALEALRLPTLTVRKIDAVMRNESTERDQELYPRLADQPQPRRGLCRARRRTLEDQGYPRRA